MGARGVLCAALALGPLLAACVDLFHDTSFASACDVNAAVCHATDANVPGEAASSADGGPDGATNFCQWDGAMAAANAAHACVWLGACEGALADDAFGACMVRARLAYDCAANPNRQVIGAAHAYWDCLWQAQSCGEVANCVEPYGTHETCAEAGTDYVACDPLTGTLLACAAGLATGTPPEGLESCAALGQTCSTVGAAACSGSTAACTSGNEGTSCADTTALHDCDPDGGPLDYGLDCANFGAGACVSGAFSACLAVNGSTSPSCAQTSQVTCDDGGYAVGCPSRVTEQLDCNAVLGLTGNPSACNPDAPGRAWDVSRACSLGDCLQADTCNGGVITSCARGATFTVDCRAQGFTSCSLALYADDPAEHAQCSNSP